MATFLIDYENVRMYGLRGLNYLSSEDHLIIFYSDVCKNFRTDDLQDIKSSGCIFETYKLNHTGQNALDFYIATEAGTLAASGVKQIAIVSKDKGYNAVIDCLKNKYGNEPDFWITRAESVEKAITLLNAPDDRARRALVQRKIKTVSLDDIADQLALVDLSEQLSELLEGTDYEELTDDIAAYIQKHSNSTPRTRYADALHTFGLNAGRQIYTLLRDNNFF